MPKTTRPVLNAERLRRVAYHEAGHALASFILGVRFRIVTIEPHEDISLGHVYFGAMRLKGDQLETRVMSPAVRDRLERRIIGCLAGREAERLVTNRYNHDGARHDLETATELVYRI